MTPSYKLVISDIKGEVPESVPPRHLPIMQLSAAEWQRHARLHAESGSEAALLHGAADDASPRPFWTVMDFARAYRAGQTTPSEVAGALLGALPAVEAAVGRVFTEVLPEEVRRQAAESDARLRAGAPRSVYEGVPVAVKDMVAVRGHRTYFGQSAAAHAPAAAEVDDPIIVRLRAAGAVVVGLTVMTEFGIDPLGWSAHWQGPRNPHNASHYTGGSSAGSAAAAAFMVVVTSCI